MFLRHKIRNRDGKRHRYWSVVENKRVAGGRVVQKHVLHLGEINDSQELAWRRSIEVLDEAEVRPKKPQFHPLRRGAALSGTRRPVCRSRPIAIARLSCALPRGK